MSKKKFVELERRITETERRVRGPEFYVCDSPKKAVDALDELGCCSNVAVLTKWEHGTLLYYDADIFLNSFERFVDLPFKANDQKKLVKGIKKLLKNIFSPFINKEGSFFRVTEMERPDTEGIHIVLSLFFSSDCYSEVYRPLAAVADSTEKIDSAFFVLD